MEQDFTPGAIRAAKYIEKFIGDINDDKGNELWHQRIAYCIDRKSGLPDLLDACKELIANAPTPPDPQAYSWARTIAKANAAIALAKKG